MAEEYNAAPFTSNRRFSAPQPQQDALKEDIQKTLSQLPLIKEVMKRLDARIAATDSVKQAIKLANEYEISRDDALVILDIVNQQLAVERNYINTKLETATKR